MAVTVGAKGRGESVRIWYTLNYRSDDISMTFGGRLALVWITYLIDTYNLQLSQISRNCSYQRKHFLSEFVLYGYILPPRHMATTIAYYYCEPDFFKHLNLSGNQ